MLNWYEIGKFAASASQHTADVMLCQGSADILSIGLSLAERFGADEWDSEEFERGYLEQIGAATDAEPPPPAKGYKKAELAKLAGVTAAVISHAIARGKLQIAVVEGKHLITTESGQRFLRQRKGRRANDEEKAEIIRLSNAGITQREIAKRLGRSETLIAKVLHSAGLFGRLGEAHYTELLRLWSEGLSPAQIAERMGVKPGIINGRVKLARERGMNFARRRKPRQSRNANSTNE